MPSMEIKTDGAGGEYGDVFQRQRGVIEMPHDVPIRIETLDHGMQSGAPSLAFIIELPQIGRVVLAQTSVKLFQMCAAATLAKYGDQTQGAILGTFDLGGAAELLLSSAEECPGCRRQIPGSSKFCPECGVRL
jgi:hypothetical protein